MPTINVISAGSVTLKIYCSDSDARELKIAVPPGSTVKVHKYTQKAPAQKKARQPRVNPRYTLSRRVDSALNALRKTEAVVDKENADYKREMERLDRDLDQWIVGRKNSLESEYVD